VPPRGSSPSILILPSLLAMVGEARRYTRDSKPPLRPPTSTISRSKTRVHISYATWRSTAKALDLCSSPPRRVFVQLCALCGDRVVSKEPQITTEALPTACCERMVCMASWPDESLFQRPPWEDRGCHRARNAQGPSRSHLRSRDLHRQALRLQAQRGKSLEPGKAPANHPRSTSELASSLKPTSRSARS
jgi:hypothetical protein